MRTRTRLDLLDGGRPRVRLSVGQRRELVARSVVVFALAATDARRAPPDAPVRDPGLISILPSDNPSVLAYLREADGERVDPPVLCVNNLSCFAQSTHLSLSAFVGSRPVELVGRSTFPPITAEGYPVTLGPYGYYWLELAASMTVDELVHALLADPSRRAHLDRQPWFQMTSGGAAPTEIAGRFGAPARRSASAAHAPCVVVPLAEPQLLRGMAAGSRGVRDPPWP